MSKKTYGLYGFTVEHPFPDHYDCYGWLTPDYVDDPGNLQGTRKRVWNNKNTRARRAAEEVRRAQVIRSI